VKHTAELLEADAPAIYEASFLADGVYVAVDVLERVDGGYNLIEVKASNSQKDEHIADAAIQTHVLRRGGLDVVRVEIMHLNGEYRHGEEGDLFQRTDVTAEVEGYLVTIETEIEEQLQAISGPRPDTEIGLCCHEPRECPFLGRCWPDDPRHVSALYSVGPRRALEFMSLGIDTIDDFPADQKFSVTTRRQLKALETGELVVEPGLAEELQPFSGRVGYLDFETVSRAIPVWAGTAPWETVPVQFSYHEEAPDGAISHKEHLATGPEDPRRRLAEALIDACSAAQRIAMYTPYERTCIRYLRRTVPDLADGLAAIEAKLIDLEPVIRKNVYHPDFKGSFSIKKVLTPLVPDLSYDDLVIQDGLVASAEIARLLLAEDEMSPEERARLRRSLLKYCEQDTRAMVRLVSRLRELAGV
jgi:predicted RecB family nuclease